MLFRSNTSRTAGTSTQLDGVRLRVRASERGITLIELLVVVTIIALFAALVGPRLFKQTGRAKLTAAKAQITADCGIDFYAGPTEIVIVAARGAPPRMTSPSGRASPCSAWPPGAA